MNILRELTAKLGDSCRESIRYEIYGGDWNHIEKIEQLPDEDGALMFEVTTWHEMSENCRVVKKMNLLEIMQLLSRYIASRAVTDAAGLFE